MTLPLRIKLVGSDGPDFHHQTLLTGRVCDAHSASVQNAIIRLLPGEEGLGVASQARSSSEGLFVRTLIPPGVWALECECGGIARSDWRRAFFTPMSMRSGRLSYSGHRLSERPGKINLAFSTPYFAPGKAGLQRTIELTAFRIVRHFAKTRYLFHRFSIHIDHLDVAPSQFFQSRLDQSPIAHHHPDDLIRTQDLFRRR